MVSRTLKQRSYRIKGLNGQKDWSLLSFQTLKRGHRNTCFDIIGWKNKALNRIEIHHTNSILVQKHDWTENLSNVSLDDNCNFKSKYHQSFKVSLCGSAKHLKYTVWIILIFASKGLCSYHKRETKGFFE